MAVNIARAVGKGDNAVASSITVPTVDQLKAAGAGETPALFIVACLSSEKPVGADKILPMALDVLADQFYSNSRGKVLGAMDEVAKESQDILAELFFKAGFGKDVFRVNLEIAMVALLKEVFYVWADGAIDMLFIRSGKLVNLRKAFGEEGQERFTGSGRFKTGDKLVVCGSLLQKREWVLDQLKSGLTQADVILTSAGRLNSSDVALILEFGAEKKVVDLVDADEESTASEKTVGELVAEEGVIGGGVDEADGDKDVLARAELPEADARDEDDFAGQAGADRGREGFGGGSGGGKKMAGNVGKTAEIGFSTIKKGLVNVWNSTLLTRLRSVVVGWARDVGYMLSSLAGAVFGGRGRRVARSATRKVNFAKIIKGVVGIVVLVAACGGIAYLANAQFIEKKKSEEYAASYTELSGKVSAFEANVLDMTVSDEQKLTAASALRSEIEALRINKYAEVTEFDLLVTKVQAGEDRVTGTIAITVLDPINDVALGFDDVNAVDFDVKGTAAYILDAQGKRVFVMDLLAKTVSVYASSDELASGVSIAWATVSKKDRLFVYDASGGVYEVNAAGTVTHLAGLSAQDASVAELATYQGNLYFLVPSERAVYKSTSSSGSFSLAATYNSSPFMADAVDMSVDGAIWLIGGNGAVQKMSRGSSGVTISEVAVTGIPSALGSGCQIDTPLTSGTTQKQYLYILDPTAKRIVAINKAPADGINYVAQIVYRGDSGWFNSLKELVLAPDGASAYVLDGSTIVKIDLSVLP